MSFPVDSPWRGCAANFPQPINADDERRAKSLMETVNRYSCYEVRPPLVAVPEIHYRSSDREEDVTRHVFRWAREPYQQIFENGFRARPQEGVPDSTYYNVEDYVHNGGRPAQEGRTQRHAFVGTTLDSSYRPPLDPNEQEARVYRYEIYAPGGIWIAATIGEKYQFPGQDEISFVAGIARQYIRSAQLFIGTRDAATGHRRWRRADNRIIINGYFNPQSHPSRLLNIQRPVFDYRDEDGNRSRPLTIVIFRPQTQALLELDEQREKRQVLGYDDPMNWYADKVANDQGYINAAFRSSRKNEAYIFMRNEYALLNYAPGTTDDKIVNGPLLICDGYPSLTATAFGEYGIDCAFNTDGNQAVIFSSNLCALIDYAPGTTDDKKLSGPMTIAAMFPFFKDTVFENGIDAAFRSSRSYEAYLFKGDQYALINYNTKNLIAIRKITEGFYSLRGTIFASGIQAAFASHRTDEAYIFKGTQYALINFAPGTTNDYIIGGVQPMLPNWPSLRSILPRNNRGLDDHDHHRNPVVGLMTSNPGADHGHDEI
ncbi:uncharacterized protein LOC113871883 [Abrus precatorius]|uniref:Uncharacterized protein LOC113871883 n=1 Tax=Abrus precatorius TaxID=3816 RepID=A0A8B8MAE1_ABRPR|nr:uncharacterized protein LOC113871883 [Abrus precatorius]